MRAIDGDALADMLSGVRRRLDPKAYKSEAELYIRDNMLLNLEEMVRSAPTIDPMKHGRWIFDDFNGDGWDYQCSVCRGYARRGTKYCPDCGARMDADE